MQDNAMFTLGILDVPKSNQKTESETMIPSYSHFNFNLPSTSKKLYNNKVFTK